MAALRGIPSSIHISSGFGFVYMLHFASFMPNICQYQEYKRGIEKYSNWFDPPLEIRNSALTVPKGPGVGIKNIGDIIKGAKQVV
jgi:L-alanine-DL-glutamate epimerase-like enolase superfamily enzyme